MPDAPRATPDAAPVLAEPRARLEEVARRLFFVVGCGRSGTTLLQSALAAGPEVSIPPETKFYAIFPPRQWLYGDPADAAAFERVVASVDEVERGRRALRYDPERFRALAGAAERSWDGVFLALLAAFGDARGTPCVGEKSPVHTHHVGRLMTAFPQARFIHVLRDPRAVVRSRMKAGFGTRQLVRHVERWRRAVEMHRRHADVLGPERYLVVRYEDLVRAFEPTIREIAAFLGLEVHPAMLAPHEQGARHFPERSRAWMENTLKPVFTGSVDRWREEMPESQIALVDRTLRAEMLEMGYEPTDARTALPGLRLATSRVLDLLGIVRRRGGNALRRVLRGGRSADLDALLDTNDDGEGDGDDRRAG